MYACVINWSKSIKHTEIQNELSVKQNIMHFKYSHDKNFFFIYFAS